MALKILNGIDVVGSHNLVASDIPNLDAGKITSGTLNGASLPWNDNDGFNGTYPIVWTATDGLYRSSWLSVRGSDDALLTRNIVADGDVTANNLNISNWNAAYSWGNHASAGYLLATGKAADSNLLDGLDSSAFLRSNANDNFSGQLVNNSLNETPGYSKGAINLQPSVSGGSTGITFRSKVNSTSDAAYIWWYDDNDHYNELNSTENGVLLIAAQNDGGATSEDAIAIESSGDIYLNAGVASGAIGSGVWNSARGNVYLGYAADRARVLSTADGSPSNWNTAYGWGNHADAGYLTSETYTGTVTSITVGTGLDVANGTTTPNITLDLSEFTDMTAAVDTAVDELILLDNGAERRKRFAEIFGDAAYQNAASMSVGEAEYATDAGFANIAAQADYASSSGEAGYATSAGSVDWAAITSKPSTFTPTSTFSATQITLGSGVVLKESTDRADLLSISSSTSGWGGLQVTNSSNEALGSFMVNDSSIGLYDDQQGEWIMLYTENAGIQFFNNGNAKLTTNSTGINVVGNVTVSGTVDGIDIAAGAANWNTAYGWGDHASAGYITSVDTSANYTWNGSHVFEQNSFTFRDCELSFDNVYDTGGNFINWLNYRSWNQSVSVGNPNLGANMVLEAGQYSMYPKAYLGGAGYGFPQRVPTAVGVELGFTYGAGQVVQMSSNSIVDGDMSGFSDPEGITVNGAGIVRIDYSVTFKSNYANRSCFGIEVVDMDTYQAVSYSTNVTYFRYNTYGEYATVAGTVYVNAPAYTKYSLQTKLLSGAANHMVQDGFMSLQLLKEI